MNRRELVRAVAAHTSQDVKQVDALVNGAIEVITAVVSQGETVSLPGFAKFTKVERPARLGRNPATGETIRIKASKRARITALKAFKDSVLNPAKAPKLARGVWPTDPGLLVKQAAAAKAAAKAAAAPATKATAKKATAKKATAKKATAKKATTKKRAATARKAPARKKAAPARRPVAKKRPAARKSTARRR